MTTSTGIKGRLMGRLKGTDRRLAALVGAAAVAVTATAVIAQAGFFEQSPSPVCTERGAVQNRDRAALLSDEPLAISGNEVVLAATGRVLDPNACIETSGMLRHLAVSPGIGAAFIVDQAGQDVLQVVDRDSTAPVASGIEITHPAWSPGGQLAWAENLQVLKVMSADGSAISGAVLPKGTVAAFSPLFIDESHIMAVVQQKIEGAPPEDESLNNLWSFDLDSGRWTQRTSFRVSGDNWIGIRTPVMAPDGAIYFVRISANASKTRPPRFELWVFEGGAATKERTLSGEMYLAGIADDKLYWNAPSRTCGDWGLFVENPDGLDQVGCGAVMTDPVAIPDPDQLVGTDDGHAAESEHMASETDELTDLVIIVGDFWSGEAASEVAGELGRSARIVGHRQAPNAVAPGKWALLVEIAPGVPVEQDLDAVRALLKGCDCGAWLAPSV